MKVYIDSDERYPHYYFYPDSEGWMPEWYVDKAIEVTDEEFQRMVKTRNDEELLQDRLKELCP